MDIIKIPIITNKRRKGNNNKSQDRPLCPSLQIKLRMYVQNSMYISLITKIAAVLGTLQENDPTL